VWSNKNVWIILSGELIAGLGLWTSIIANLEFMQKYVASDFLKSLILFVGLLAGVLIGPLAGRVIDTKNKKTVLFYSGVGRLISVCFMFLALYQESVWWMVVFAVVLQMASAFYFPTLQSLIPIVVDEKDLLTMNGIHMNVITISRVIGTVAAGLMLAVMSLYTLYVASFVAYILLLLSTLLLQVKEEKRESKLSSNGEKEGFFALFKVIRELPGIYTVLLLTIVPTLFIGGFNLLIINISELQDDTQIKSILYATEGICFIVSSFFVKKAAVGRNPVTLVFLFAFLIAFAHMSLVFSSSKLIAIISFGLFGLAIGFFYPLVSTLFQTRIPKEVHGRFFSFRSMLDRVMFQVVLVGTGLFLDTIGLQKMVILFGMVSLAVTLAVMMREVKERSRVKKQDNKVFDA
jgi:MFS family permease